MTLLIETQALDAFATDAHPLDALNEAVIIFAERHGYELAEVCNALRTVLATAVITENLMDAHDFRRKPMGYGKPAAQGKPDRG